MSTHVNTLDHPIENRSYASKCKAILDSTGALVLNGFFKAETIAKIVAAAAPQEQTAFYAKSTHNVYLTPPNPNLPDHHAFNRQVISSKGILADDQIPPDSPLREIYNSADFRTFLCWVLGIDKIHSYADNLSSINVHFAPAGNELGWHFDNSSFAVTMLLQAPEGCGSFEYVQAVRDADAGDMAYRRVEEILDGREEAETLSFDPGDLVLFRGRDAMHRVTPTEGAVTRLLVVFAFNDQPGIGLSESALTTFYGRTE